MQSENEKEQRIMELENENRLLLDKIARLEHNVEALTQAVLYASKLRFGASTEKTPQLEGQYFFFDKEIENSIEASLINVIDIKGYKRNVRKKGDTEKVTKAIPHEVVECILTSEEAICDICGSELKIIGKKKVRSEMEYIPAKLLVKDYVQYVYKCTECGTNDTNPYDRIIAAPISAPVLTHSIASASSVAWIINQKYVMSAPLYRQEKDFVRMGALLRRDTMANWVIRSSEYWLRPLYERMHERLLNCSIIMSDETTWQVNHEIGKKASSKSYIWVHRSGSFEDIPVILYEYTRSRSGDHAKKFLTGFNGFHVSDAYDGYEKVEGITRCLCFSHLRRYYIEAIPLDSGKKEIPGSGGAIGRAYCDKLFKLEKKWKTLSPEERKKNRLIYSVPVLEAFFAWAESVSTNQENLKKALKYTLNHKKYFTNFLLDGRIPLSNNLSEIAVKPVAITRKNSLFSDSPAGAEASAIIFSIVNSATANNVDPYKYLEYIFRRLPNIKFSSGDPILNEYLPWSDTIQLECKMSTLKNVAMDKEDTCNESA